MKYGFLLYKNLLYVNRTFTIIFCTIKVNWITFHLVSIKELRFLVIYAYIFHVKKCFDYTQKTKLALFLLNFQHEGIINA